MCHERGWSAGRSDSCTTAAPTATAAEKAVVAERYPRNTSVRAICWRISAIWVKASRSSMRLHKTVHRNDRTGTTEGV